MTCGTAVWIGRVWPGSTSFPNPMVAIGPNLRSGGGKFREIAEEMCGKEVNTDGLPRDREELRGKLHRFMQKLGKLPARIARYFEHKYIAYAAAPEPNLT